jgi:hypothetical protein
VVIETSSRGIGPVVGGRRFLTQGSKVLNLSHNSDRQRWWRLGDVALTLMLHGVMVAVVAVATALPMVDGHLIDALAASLNDGAHTLNTWLHIGAHVGLSALAWSALWWGGRSLRERWEAAPMPRVRLGTVMIETLVVLPVALMLIFGLAQLAVINTASILMNVASFQATRTAWVWHPEASNSGDNSRMGVTEQKVKEMVRVQAASVLTPVAPGGYTASAEVSEEAAQARGMFLGAQSPIPFEDSGNAGRILGDKIAEMGADNPLVRSQHSFSGAVDAASFPVRTARKFTFAYHAVPQAELIIEPGYGADSEPTLEVTLVYYQFCAFPVVNLMFGEQETIGERTGHYVRIERTLTRQAQLDVAADWPRWESGTPERTIDIF